MNHEEQQEYLRKYKEKKAAGELFFPDSIAKDAVVSLGIFILLICLVIFLGVPPEPPANPGDSSYIPRPEWYFMWAFQALKYFPGQLEGVAIVGLGVLIGVGLFGLPFFDRGPKRHPLNRPIASIGMILIVIGLVVLSVLGVISTPAQTEGEVIGGTKAELIAAGAGLYDEHCAECHGAEGEGGELPESPGTFTAPINTEDFLFTHQDDTIQAIIAFGQPGEGMPAFGVTYGGEMSDQQIRAIIAFMRGWAEPEPEAPADAAATADLAKIESPSFAKDVKPILDAKCLNCHGKRVKANYSVADYTKVMTSGDHAPSIVAGDAARSTMALMLRGIKTEAGGRMPPSKPLKKEQIDLIERWINQGALNN